MWNVRYKGFSSECIQAHHTDMTITLNQQKTVAAAIFTNSNRQLKTQHSWQQPSRALSCVSNPTGPSVAAQVSLQPDSTAAKQKKSPVCSYNEWDLLEV